MALLGTARRAAGWDVGAYRDRSSGVQAVVDMAGPSDLLTMGDQGTDARRRELHLAPRQRAEPTTRSRPEQGQPDHVRQKGGPPFLILDSNNDKIVYPRQSEELAWYLGWPGPP